MKIPVVGLVAFLASCACVSGQWYNFLSGAVDNLFAPIFEGPPPSFQEWQHQRFQEHVKVHSVELVTWLGSKWEGAECPALPTHCV